MTGEIEGKLHTNVPQAVGVQVCFGIIDRSHGLAAILDWRKILNNVFSGTTEPIEVKLHIYDLVVMGNTCFKFQLDQAHGLAARIILFFDLGFIFIFLCLRTKGARGIIF